MSTKMKLGPRQKKWIADIPEYVQAHGELCDGKGFCCLGVYAHTQVEEPWVDDVDNWHYLDKDGRPNRVTLGDGDWEELGLWSGEGRFKVGILYKGKTYGTLAILNDSKQITPKEMSAFIKRNASEIFKKAA